MKIHRLDRIMITEAEIAEIVSGISQRISGDFSMAEESVVLIYVENGASYFCSELEDNLLSAGFDFDVDSIRVSSYGAGTMSSGHIRFEHGPVDSFAGKIVVIVEDIVDTGYSMRFLIDYFYRGGARRVLVAALLSKPSRRRVDVHIDYLGLSIPDEFVVGFGLDFNQKYRGLADIWTIQVVGFWEWLQHLFTEGRYPHPRQW